MVEVELGGGKEGNEFGVEVGEEMERGVNEVRVRGEMVEEKKRVGEMEIGKGRLVMVVKGGNELVIGKGEMELKGGEKLVVI